MPLQFDIFRLSDHSLVVVLQHDLIEGLRSRIVAPLVTAAKAGPATKGLNPAIEVSEKLYLIKPEFMSALPVSQLRTKVGDAKHIRDEIIRAVDLLVTGF